MSPDDSPQESRRRWLVLATMTGALSMILLDQTVVSVALPTDDAGLHRLDEFGRREAARPGQRCNPDRAPGRRHRRPGGVMGTVVATIESNKLDGLSAAPTAAAAHDALSTAVSAAYYVAGDALLVGHSVAALLLRHLSAGDAEPPPAQAVSPSQ